MVIIIAPNKNQSSTEHITSVFSLGGPQLFWQVQMELLPTAATATLPAVTET